MDVYKLSSVNWISQREIVFSKLIKFCSNEYLRPKYVIFAVQHIDF